ncbi:hypothetical protein BDY24DRAFT_286061 [Mrakia frigida]|uniref:uncharacterized protein n=1 Tax=Mrakia frigida TaxID=29902 RepID=UPI003FCC015B
MCRVFHLPSGRAKSLERGGTAQRPSGNGRVQFLLWMLCFLFFCVGAQGRLVLLLWKEAVTGRGLRTRSGDERDSLLSLLLFFSLSFISFFSLPQFSDPAHQLSLFLHSVRRSLPVGNA